MTEFQPNPPRDLPPVAIRNLRRRYGLVRWPAAVFLVLLITQFLLGKAGVEELAIGAAVPVLMCTAAWLFHRRAIRLARFGQVVDGRITAVRGYPALRNFIRLHGMVDVVIEYRFDNEVFRWKKSVHKAFNPQVDATVQVIIDPRVPRRAMLLFDLWSRLAKS